VNLGWGNNSTTTVDMSSLIFAVSLGWVF